MILFLDLETSGTNENKNSILQIGACWYDRPETFYRSVELEPGTDAEPDALRVNGETHHSLGCPHRTPGWLAFGEFLGWVKGRCGDIRKGEKARVMLAGWNVHFDYRFIFALARKLGVEDALPFRHQLLDLHSLALVEQMHRRHHAADAALFGSDLLRGADHAAQMLGIQPEAKPHNALAGALHAREMAHAIDLPFVVGTEVRKPKCDDAPAQPPAVRRKNK
jgi:DNA polymerase III epsilon subunit-like protein